MDKMDKMTKEQREQALLEYRQRLDKKIKTGRTVVYVIAIINVVMAGASAAVNFNLISLIVQIVFSVALCAGVAWVRFLFAAGAGFNAITTLMLLTTAAAELPLWMPFVIVFNVVICAASCVTLFYSESVREFMRARKRR